MAAQLAVRLNPANPNHHLWNNHGTWWLHYTIHRPDFTKQRIRLSLRTPVLAQARQARDAFLSGKDEFHLVPISPPERPESLSGISRISWFPRR